MTTRSYIARSYIVEALKVQMCINDVKKAFKPSTNRCKNELNTRKVCKCFPCIQEHKSRRKQIIEHKLLKKEIEYEDKNLC